MRDVAAETRIQQGPKTTSEESARRFECLRDAGCWNQLDPPKLDQSIAKARSRFGGARGLEKQAMTILKWALIFFVISVVAGILGFTGISVASADVARFLFYVFVVIFLVLLILGLTILRA